MLRLTAVLLAFGVARAAFAFWYGSVPSDDVPLMAEPSPGSQVLRTLPRGTRFTAVDQSKQGYYRVRTATETGWIDASIIDAQNPKTKGEPKAPPPPSAENERPRSRAQETRRSGRNDYKGDRWGIRALLNLDLYKPSDVTNAIGSDALGNGTGFGGELSYRLDRKWDLALRIESVSKSASGDATDITPPTGFQFSLKTTSITVGPDYILSDTPDYSLHILARVGFAPTSLDAIATDLDSPNETRYSGTAFTGIFGLGGDYKFTESFMAGVEAGYRLLKTSQSAPTLEGNDSGFFGNPAAALSLNMSGVVLGLDLKLTF